jgi:hypothetical protein
VSKGRGVTITSYTRSASVRFSTPFRVCSVLLEGHNAQLFMRKKRKRKRKKKKKKKNSLTKGMFYLEKKGGRKQKKSELRKKHPSCVSIHAY